MYLAHQNYAPLHWACVSKNELFLVLHRLNQEILSWASSFLVKLCESMKDQSKLPFQNSYQKHSIYL